MSHQKKRIAKSKLENLKLWRSVAKSGKFEDLISDVIHVLDYLMEQEERRGK